MTVKQLIEILQTCSDSDIVALYDVENGERIDEISVDDTLYGFVDINFNDR